MWPTILTWVMRVVPVIPSLVTDIENLWRGQPKKGPQKWLGVEQAISGSIQEVASEAAKLAPAGTKTEEITKAVSVFAKAVNDASVELANTLGIFQHGSSSGS